MLSWSPLGARPASRGAVRAGAARGRCRASTCPARARRPAGGGRRSLCARPRPGPGDPAAAGPAPVGRIGGGGGGAPAARPPAPSGAPAPPPIPARGAAPRPPPPPARRRRRGSKGRSRRQRAGRGASRKPAGQVGEEGKEPRNSGRRWRRTGRPRTESRRDLPPAEGTASGLGPAGAVMSVSELYSQVSAGRAEPGARGRRRGARPAGARYPAVPSGRRPLLGASQLRAASEPLTSGGGESLAVPGAPRPGPYPGSPKPCRSCPRPGAVRPKPPAPSGSEPGPRGPPFPPRRPRWAPTRGPPPRCSAARSYEGDPLSCQRGGTLNSGGDPLACQRI